MADSENKPLTRAHWLVLAAAFMGWMFDGLEMGLFPLVARPALQDLAGIGEESEESLLTKDQETASPLPPDTTGSVLSVKNEDADIEKFVALWNGRIIAFFLFGAATGGLLFGWLGDKIGRVRAMMYSVLCYSGFTGLCFFAESPLQLGVLRFFAALGMGGEWSLGVALVMECWPEKLRPLMAGIIGAAANVGFLSISVLAMFIEVTVESWRWMMIAGAAPAVLTIFIRFFVPESERWQESVKKETVNPIKEILSPGLLKPTILAICFASIALIGTWGAISGFLPVWVDQLAGGDAKLRITANVLSSAPEGAEGSFARAVVADAGGESATVDADGDDPKYTLKKKRRDKEEDLNKPRQTFEYVLTNQSKQDSENVVVTAMLPIDIVDLATVELDTRNRGEATLDSNSGLLTWTVGKLEFKDPFAKATTQFAISIGAIIGCLAGPLLGGRIGRRPAYFFLCLSSFVVCMYLFNALDEYNFTFLIFSGLAGLTTASFYGWLPLYLPELFPTRVRATGQGLSFNFGRISAAFAAMGTGLLMVMVGESYPNACSIVTLIYLVGMVLIWFAPETKGKPLPD